jgi:hypothetical protein
VALFFNRALALISSELFDSFKANDKPINKIIGMMIIKNGDAEVVDFFMVVNLLMLSKISQSKLHKNNFI